MINNYIVFGDWLLKEFLSKILFKESASKIYLRYNHNGETYHYFIRTLLSPLCYFIYAQ